MEFIQGGRHEATPDFADSQCGAMREEKYAEHQSENSCCNVVVPAVSLRIITAPAFVARARVEPLLFTL